MKRPSTPEAFAACVLALALASSCGNGRSAVGSDGGGGAGGAGGPDGGPLTGEPIPLAQLCAAYTTALCTYFTQCGSPDFRDFNHCLAETDCLGVATLASEVAAGAIGYDATRAGACQARFLADPCHFATFLFTPSIFQVLAECAGTLTPMQQTGEPCVDLRECSPGSFCKKRNGYVCPGACTPYPNVGDACAATVPCAPGMRCRDSICYLAPKAGDACTGDAECLSGIVSCPGGDPACGSDNLWCDLAGTGTCRKGVALGATCGTVPVNGVSTTIACDSAFWCDAFLNEAGTCRAYGGAGTACNEWGCAAGLHCNGDFSVGPMATLGTCMPPAPIGGPCNFTQECATDLACSSSTCTARADVNGPCSIDADCQTGLFCSPDTFVCLGARYPGDSCADPGSGCVHSLCRAGICVDHTKAGQPCASNDDCISIACTNGTCLDQTVCAN